MSNPCSGRIYGYRDPKGHLCQYLGKVQRDGKWFCGIHDPEKRKARREARALQWNEELCQDAAIREEGGRLAKLLGVNADLNYNWTRRVSRALVIRFEDVERLIERLGESRS